ncbi:MAG TPA: FeoA domain-containing protein [Longimicrobiales bacterium]
MSGGQRLGGDGAAGAGHLISLAGVHRGEVFRVQRILFDELRRLCDRLDLHEGDVVECRADAGPLLVLETAGGRTVALERDWARFVRVASVGERRS